MTEQARPVWADLVENVAVNPAQIEWPADEHGITSALKKAFASVGTAAKGNKQKEETIIATIMVGLAHVRKRVRKDAEVQERRLADIRRAAEARKPLERFNSHITTKE